VCVESSSSGRRRCTLSLVVGAVDQVDICCATETNYAPRTAWNRCTVALNYLVGGYILSVLMRLEHTVNRPCPLFSLCESRKSTFLTFASSTSWSSMWRFFHRLRSSTSTSRSAGEQRFTCGPLFIPIPWIGSKRRSLGAEKYPEGKFLPPLPAWKLDYIDVLPGQWIPRKYILPFPGAAIYPSIIFLATTTEGESPRTIRHEVSKVLHVVGIL